MLSCRYLSYLIYCCCILIQIAFSKVADGTTTNIKAFPITRVLSDKERAASNKFLNIVYGRHKPLQLFEDSDYLKLFISNTTLPDLQETHHQGLFAKRRIQAGEFICEFRGKIVALDDAVNKLRLNSDYFHSTGDPKTIMLPIDSPCMYVNDCISILTNPKIRNTDFLKKWIKLSEDTGTKAPVPDEIQCSAGSGGHSHNSAIMVMGSSQHKSFLIASQDIEPGEEIFVFYGHGYWLPRAVSLFQHGHMNTCTDCKKLSLLRQTDTSTQLPRSMN